MLFAVDSDPAEPKRGVIHVKKAALYLLAILMVFSCCSCGVDSAASGLGKQVLSICDDYKGGKIAADDARTKIKNIGLQVYTMEKDKADAEKGNLHRINVAIGNLYSDMAEPTGKDNEEMQKIRDKRIERDYTQLKRDLGLVSGRLDGMNNATYEKGIQALEICEKYISGQINASKAFPQIDKINTEIKNMCAELTAAGATRYDSQELDAATITGEDIMLLRSQLDIYKRSAGASKANIIRYEFYTWYGKLKNHLGK